MKLRSSDNEILFVEYIKFHSKCGKPAPFGTSGFGPVHGGESSHFRGMPGTPSHQAFLKKFLGLLQLLLRPVSETGVNVSWLPISTGTLTMTYMFHASCCKLIKTCSLLVQIGDRDRKTNGAKAELRRLEVGLSNQAS